MIKNTKCHECGAVMKEKKIRYHYAESGLENVYLDGVSEFSCPECKEKSVEILAPAQLHIVLAIALASKKGLLIGPEIRFMRKEIGMTSKSFADFIGVSHVTLSRWENDKGSANKTESNDRLIRLAFMKMMSELQSSVISYLEEQITRNRAVSFKGKHVDIDTVATQRIVVPHLNYDVIAH